MVVFSCVHAPNPAHADRGCYCRTNRLRKDGAAEKTKQLQIFDHLVSINGEASDGISHDSAVHILERSQAEITLEVQTLEGAQDADGAVVGNTLKGKTLLAQVDYERSVTRKKNVLHTSHLAGAANTLGCRNGMCSNALSLAGSGMEVGLETRNHR